MSSQFKVDELKTLFNCKYCSKLLVNPVALPCGVTVCESHVAGIIDGECIYCNKKHDNEHKINEVLKKMLDLEVNSIKLCPQVVNLEFLS